MPFGAAPGGVKTTVIYGDDLRKLDVGLRVARKTISSDKVDIIAGILRSNVLAAVSRAVVRNGAIMVSTDAGRSQRAGRQGSRYFINKSWNNDQTFEATGQSMRNEKIKSMFMMAPNYRASLAA